MSTSTRRSSRSERELPSRPRTSHDFRPTSSKPGSRDFAPPKRSATPAISSSSSRSSSHRSTDKKDKGYSGRGKKKEKEKNRALAAVDEEAEEEEEGGASVLEPEQRFGATVSTRNDGYGRMGDPSIFDDGRFRQGTIIPDILNTTQNEFTEDESLAFWSWDMQRQNWYHYDSQTGETIWAPAQFA